ncbi:DUF6089 family protein [Reichenbachiella versicolor]|uniref:DUF6089 family protein n=1 Tax=Reichenbachiella versicolor TaxID=1821036 RepID=UPI000D6E3841|nr:DUF6089 family protein [Reichenbachiella versicolor]
MNNKLILSLVLLVTVTLSFNVEAQYKRRKRSNYGYSKKNNQKKFSKYSGGKVGYSGVGNPKYKTVGFSINTGTYMGDLTAGNSKFSADYAGSFIPRGLGLTYSKVVYPGVFLRGGFNWIRLQGSDYRDSGDVNAEDASDRGRYARNFHFRNDILEISAGFELDLIPSNSGARGRFPINPFVYLGVAGFYNNPKAIAPETDQAGNPTGKGGEWVALQPLNTSNESYSRFQFAVPIGLGVKVKVTRDIDVNLEFGLRYTFTDYIDDVGGTYKDLDEFGTNHLARAMSERGANANAYLKGDSQVRDNALYNVTTTNVKNPDLLADPSWTGDSFYTHGENYSPRTDSYEGFTRGGKTNDFYVTTQIRVVYILDKKGMSKGKFR